MLQNITPIYNKVLQAIDGEIGRCREFLFDDRFWTVRYMVADTRKWLPGRKVLISPMALKRNGLHADLLPVKLSRAQIKASPGLEEDLPVSRQYEIACAQYYGWAHYWHGPLAWGPVDNFNSLPGQEALQAGSGDDTDSDSTHLRSAKEVAGYYVEAGKDSVGRITDLILDDGSWTIRYLVIQTGGWFSDRKILISPMWARFIDWSSNKVGVDLSPSQMRSLPEYDPTVPITRELEDLIFSGWSKDSYWEKERKKIGDRMIKAGDKRLNESQTLRKKGQKILFEKSSQLKQIKTRIEEGKKITKEAEKLIKKGENIVAESDFPQRNVGIRQVVVGKKMKKTGQKRIEHYEKKLKTTKEWIKTGETMIKDGKETKQFGETLKQSGSELVKPTHHND